MPVVNYAAFNGLLVGETTSTGSTIYLTDALGSVTTTTDQSGDILNQYRYKPYGGLLSKTGTAGDPKFLWAGAVGYRQTDITYTDAYIRARHYGSSFSQWTTVDPLWPKQSKFVYAEARPTTSVDPSGLELTRNCCYCPDTLSVNIVDFYGTGSSFDECDGVTITRWQAGDFGWHVTVKYTIAGYDNGKKPGGGTVFRFQESWSDSNGLSQTTDSLSQQGEWVGSWQQCQTKNNNNCTVSGTGCSQTYSCTLYDDPSAFCQAIGIKPPSIATWYLLTQKFSLYFIGPGDCSECGIPLVITKTYFIQWSGPCKNSSGYVKPTTWTP